MKKHGAINPKILASAKAFSAKLAERRIPHALAGGLALAAYGYERATSDVDFFVSAAYEEEIAGDPLGGEVVGKTTRFRGVAVDCIFPREGEEFLEDAIERAKMVNGIPTLPPEALVYTKIAAGRMKDSADIVELVKCGALDEARVAAYLGRHRSYIVEEFEALARQAMLERLKR